MPNDPSQTFELIQKYGVVTGLFIVLILVITGILILFVRRGIRRDETMAAALLEYGKAAQIREDKLQKAQEDLQVYIRGSLAGMIQNLASVVERNTAISERVNRAIENCEASRH